jgi:hypothetical protein
MTMIPKIPPIVPWLLVAVGLPFLAWSPPSEAAENPRFQVHTATASCVDQPSRFELSSAVLTTGRFAWKGADTGSCCPCSDLIFADGFENGSVAFWGPPTANAPTAQGDHHASSVDVHHHPDHHPHAERSLRR